MSSEQVKKLVIDYANLEISNSDLIYTLYELGYINVEIKLIKGELFLTCEYNHPILENIYFFKIKELSKKNTYYWEFLENGYLFNSDTSIFNKKLCLYDNNKNIIADNLKGCRVFDNNWYYLKTNNKFSLYDNNKNLIANNLDWCSVYANKYYVLDINNNFSLYDLNGELIEKDLLFCECYENGFYIKVVEEEIQF